MAPELTGMHPRRAALFDWTLDEDDMVALTAATVPAVAGNPGPGGVPVSGDCDVA